MTATLITGRQQTLRILAVTDANGVLVNTATVVVTLYRLTNLSTPVGGINQITAASSGNGNYDVVVPTSFSATPDTNYVVKATITVAGATEDFWIPIIVSNPVVTS